MMSADSTPSEVPVSLVTLDQLVTDPYPHYRAMRDLAPVVWVPAANRHFVTRYKDILQIERQPDVFSSQERDSMMNRAIGSTMLRLDGAAHSRIRSALEPGLRQGFIKEYWKAVFQEVVDELLDQLESRGEADLFVDFAGPCAAACLGRLLGLRNASPADLRRWSQAIIDGCGNYSDDHKIWARCALASREIDAALADIAPYLKENPDGSLVSALQHSPAAFTPEEIKANVMVLMGGGLNEPRDAIVVGTFALLTQPEQRAMVEADPQKWMHVFEETVRWVSPVGMYPRQTTRRTELLGLTVEEGARIGVSVASGNRDERVFNDPDVFNIARARKPNLAFGGGAHYCLGVSAARILVGEIALPQLFKRLKGLALSTKIPTTWTGWVFRGPINLPVEWRAE
jgi:cytochrome P450